MRKLVVVIVIASVVLLSTVISGVASAQPYPSVGGLKALTAEADYVSLPGYLRDVVNQKSNQWLTYRESSRIAQQRTGEQGTPTQSSGHPTIFSSASRDGRMTAVAVTWATGAVSPSEYRNVSK